MHIDVLTCSVISGHQCFLRRFPLQLEEAQRFFQATHFLSMLDVSRLTRAYLAIKVEVG